MDAEVKVRFLEIEMFITIYTLQVTVEALRLKMHLCADTTTALSSFIDIVTSRFSPSEPK